MANEVKRGRIFILFWRSEGTQILGIGMCRCDYKRQDTVRWGSHFSPFSHISPSRYPFPDITLPHLSLLRSQSTQISPQLPVHYTSHGYPLPQNPGVVAFAHDLFQSQFRFHSVRSITYITCTAGLELVRGLLTSRLLVFNARLGSMRSHSHKCV